MKPNVWQQLGMLSLLPMVSGYACAAGYKVNEYSTIALGAANSYGAAQANDASTVFSNPAGMTRLTATEITGNLHLIKVDGEFSNNGSTDVSGAPITGSSGGNVAPLLEVPTFYWVSPLADGWAVGLGITVPYGLTTDYDKDFVGRYAALESDLLTLDINPSIAYQINDNFSVGFGISARYADVTLSNAIDYGGVCYGAVGPDLCTTIGLTPQDVDGQVKLAGDDWGFGYNFGVLYTTDKLRVGAQYRSKIEYTLEGDAKFNNPALVEQILVPFSGGAFTNTGIEADLTLPETWSLSAVYQINDQWAIMGDYLHTQWTRFKTLAVSFDNAAQPDLVEEENWDNSTRIAVGAEYKHKANWTFRGGLAHDESPVPEEFSRPRIPDSDRTIIAAGFSWSPNGESGPWRVDGAYNYIFADDSDLVTAGSYGETLRGSYDSTDVNILSLGLTYVF